MKFRIIIVFSLLASLLFGQNPVDSIVTLPFDEFITMYHQSKLAVLLDCRTKEDFDKEHLENAVWVGTKVELYKMLLGKTENTNFFVYCKSGKERGPEVVKILQAKNFKHCYNLKEGYNGYLKKKIGGKSSY